MQMAACPAQNPAREDELNLALTPNAGHKLAQEARLLCFEHQACRHHTAVQNQQHVPWAGWRPACSGPGWAARPVCCRAGVPPQLPAAGRPVAAPSGQAGLAPPAGSPAARHSRHRRELVFAPCAVTRRSPNTTPLTGQPCKQRQTKQGKSARTCQPGERTSGSSSSSSSSPGRWAQACARAAGSAISSTGAPAHTASTACSGCQCGWARQACLGQGRKHVWRWKQMDGATGSLLSPGVVRQCRARASARRQLPPGWRVCGRSTACTAAGRNSMHRAELKAWTAHRKRHVRQIKRLVGTSASG